MIYTEGEFGIFPAKNIKGLTPKKQVTLAWLIFHTNTNTGVAFPSVNTLCDECGISSRTTMIGVLNELEREGFIRKRYRQKEGGGCTSNEYEVFIKRTTPCSENEQPPVQKLDTNYKKINQKNITIKDDASVDAAFESAWAAYERKGNKQKSLRYWKKLTDEDRSSITETIPKYLASRPDKKFRKNFEGWINPANRMWEDEIIADDEVDTKKGRMSAQQMKEWNKEYGNG